MNGDAVVQNETQMEAVLPTVTELFLLQGFCSLPRRHPSRIICSWAWVKHFGHELQATVHTALDDTTSAEIPKRAQSASLISASSSGLNRPGFTGDSIS